MPLFLTCLDYCQMEILCSAQYQLSLVHELRVMLMPADELDVNAIYYAQHPALNEISLWKKATGNRW